MWKYQQQTMNYYAQSDVDKRLVEDYDAFLNKIIKKILF